MGKGARLVLSLLWCGCAPLPEQPLWPALATPEVEAGLDQITHQRAHFGWQLAFAEGEEAVRAGDTVGAEAAFREALAVAEGCESDDPVWTTARIASHYALGLRLVERGLRAEAILHFSAAWALVEAHHADPLTAGYHGTLALLAWGAAVAEEAGGTAAAVHRQKAHALAQELVEAAPEDPRTLQALALTHEALSRQAADRGDRAVARLHAAGVLGVRRRWVAAAPDDPIALHNLTIAMDKWGTTEDEAGDLDAARQAFEAALVIRDQHLATHTGDRHWLEGLAQSHRLLSEVARRQGDHAAADRHLAAMRAAQARATEAGADVDRQVVAEQSRLADQRDGAGQLVLAWEHLQTALAAQERLVARDPGSLITRHNRALLHKRLSEVARARGDTPTARRHLEQAFTEQRALVEADQNTALFRQNLAGYHEAMAQFAALDRDREAEGRHRQAALDLYRGLATDPAVRRHRYNLIIGLLDRSDFMRRRGDPAAAQAAADEALSVAEALVARHPADADVLDVLESAHQTQGMVAEARGDLEAAARWHQHTFERAETAAGRDPDSLEAQRNLGIAWFRLGHNASLRGQRALALERLERALVIAEALATRNAENVRSTRDLATVQTRLFDLLAPEDLPRARRHADAALRLYAPQSAETTDLSDQAPPTPDGSATPVRATPVQPDVVELRLLRWVQRTAAQAAGLAGEWTTAQRLASAALAGAEDDPTDDSLAPSHIRVGHLAHAQGALPRARHHFAAALALEEARLTAGDPRAAEVAAAHLALGAVALDAGEAGAARAAFAAALALAEAPPPTDPLEWPRLQAEALEGLGRAAALAGDFSMSFKYLSEALPLREQTLAADPDHPDRAADLARVEADLGEVLAARGDLAAATTALTQALSRFEALLRQNPTHVWRQVHWQETAARLAQVRARARDPAGARAVLDRVLAVPASAEVDRRTLARLRLHSLASGVADGRPAEGHRAEVRRLLGVLEAAEAFVGHPHREATRRAAR